MDFSTLSGRKARPATWSEREQLAELRAAGAEDVYLGLDTAAEDDRLWQVLLMATNEFLLSARVDEWEKWYGEYRWAQALPETTAGFYSDLYETILLQGRYVKGGLWTRLSVGQRLSAVEHLMDMISNGNVEAFAAAVNERMRQLRVGLRIEGPRFVSVTSEHMHTEVTVPALLLLSRLELAPVDKLFRKAYERSFANDHAGAVTSATSAVEEMLRIGLGESGGQLRPLLSKAHAQGWIIPAAEQLAVKLAALRDSSDAHTEGTDDPAVAMLAIHVSASLLIYLGQVAPQARP